MRTTAEFVGPPGQRLPHHAADANIESILIQYWIVTLRWEIAVPQLEIGATRGPNG